MYEKLLSDYHLQMEMAAGSYVIAMTSIGDTKEGMDRLICALVEIDAQLEKKQGEQQSYDLPRGQNITQVLKPKKSG